jgi:hypothetical protein
MFEAFTNYGFLIVAVGGAIVLGLTLLAVAIR